jgi:SAM-dependent methyltransferase
VKFEVVAQNLLEGVALACGCVPTPLMDTLIGPLLAKTVIAGTSLGIFDAVGDNSLLCEEISEHCRTDAAPTEKLLKALCACGYLRTKNGRYELTRMSRRWMLTNSLESLQAAILHRNIDLRFMCFEEYVRDGKVHGFHDALSAEDWERYHEGQASQAALIVDEVVKQVPLPARATDMLDLGGGHGLYSLAFCQRYPQLQARVLDLAITSKRVQSRSRFDSAADRVRFDVADIRTARLPELSSDVVLLANVLHHFDQETSRLLIQRACHALRPGGLLIVLDVVSSHATQRPEQLEALLDLYFGAVSGTGLCTLSDIRSWQRHAGLHPLPAVGLRLLPSCKIQMARKDD